MQLLTEITAKNIMCICYIHSCVNKEDKMKKRLMAVLMIAVMMFSLVGCSPNMMSYSKELQRVSQWEGTSIDAKANIEVEVKDEKAIKFSIPMELKGKSKGQNLVQMNMKMDLKAIKSMAKELGEEIPVSIPDE